MPDFEKSFSDFLNCKEYDNAEAALFAIVRLSFKAGWLAAGGKLPEPQKLVDPLRPQRGAPSEAKPPAGKRQA